LAWLKLLFNNSFNHKLAASQQKIFCGISGLRSLHGW
jgi:hypothetical protein